MSTYTILRASKLFEWNKLNPNSNEAKKAAALERELRGERRRKAYPKKSSKKQQNANESPDEPSNYLNQSTSSVELPPPTALQIISLNQQQQQQQQEEEPQQQHDSTSIANDLLALNNENFDYLYDLKIINEREIISLKNTACSPMSFATKVLFRVFCLDELHGHNVSGKTFHKHISHKEPLEEKRLMYIKWLVEKYFYYPFILSLSSTTTTTTNNQASSSTTPTNTSSSINNNNYLNDANVYYYKNRDVLWKACCNAINKMIRRSEVSHLKKLEAGLDNNQQLTIQSTYSSIDQQHQHVVQLSSGTGGGGGGGGGNITNINKFNQLTQYLINEERNDAFDDEIELIPGHKRSNIFQQQQQQTKLEANEDSDGEIELLNENKLMMNITNQTNLNGASSELNSDEKDEDEEEEEDKNEIPVLKRSPRLANKKAINKNEILKGLKTSPKQQVVKKAPKSNYYYESDEDYEDTEDDDEDMDEDDDDDDEDDEDDDEEYQKPSKFILYMKQHPKITIFQTIRVILNTKNQSILLKVISLD